MIIEIEGYFFESVFATGKKRTKQELQRMIKETSSKVEKAKDFPFLFCRMHGFDLLNNTTEVEPDYTLDTDIDYVY